ncbi:hypothetical protein KNO15_20960 [Leifsonia shinshuensis]|uniref:hypothetical protein n=1 Tax=Leifsonia shinshuensis TaxID=150026 RepID=UPI001F5051CF|nr:hypothetical protein [Leifsonia shinshuensis]MCI0159179.1 hypothetical protein [Leifsonia shinshuensis]
MKRTAFVFAAATLVAAISGCSTQAQTAVVGKLADSYTALIEEKLGGTLTEFETEVLERALDRGTISQSDYEAAHGRYRECMAQHGIETEERRFPNGVIHSTPPGPDEQFTVEQLIDVDYRCAISTIFVIDELYVVQQGNPGLLRDTSAAGRECLIREGLAPSSFSRDDFESAFGPGNDDYDSLPFDVRDELVQMCLFTAHIVLGFAE